MIIPEDDKKQAPPLPPRPTDGPPPPHPDHHSSSSGTDSYTMSTASTSDRDTKSSAVPPPLPQRSLQHPSEPDPFDDSDSVHTRAPTYVESQELPAGAGREAIVEAADKEEEELTSGEREFLKREKTLPSVLFAIPFPPAKGKPPKAETIPFLL